MNNSTNQIPHLEEHVEIQCVFSKPMPFYSRNLYACEFKEKCEHKYHLGDYTFCRKKLNSKSNSKSIKLAEFAQHPYLQ